MESHHAGVYRQIEAQPVFLRYTGMGIPRQKEVCYVDETREQFVQHIPLPTTAGDINLGRVVVPAGGGLVTFRRVKINGLSVEWASLWSADYADNARIGILQDVLTDLRLFLIGAGLLPQLEPSKQPGVLAHDVIAQLRSLLKEFERRLNDARREEDIQAFLAEHAILIKPYTQIVPKQKLGEEFVTDIVLVNQLDQGRHHTLVELERPSMRVFTKAGDFTADFNHAHRQILDWQAWVEDNGAYIREKLPGFESPGYLIVAGRSSELSKKEKTRIGQWNKEHRGTTFRTYDDLICRTKELVESLAREASLRYPSNSVELGL